MPIIDTDTRKSLGNDAANIGELVARRLFDSRGNNDEVSLTERELAMIVGTGAQVADGIATACVDDVIRDLPINEPIVWRRL
jgi:hypothetical protein